MKSFYFFFSYKTITINFSLLFWEVQSKMSILTSNLFRNREIKMKRMRVDLYPLLFWRFILITMHKTQIRSVIYWIKKWRKRKKLFLFFSDVRLFDGNRNVGPLLHCAANLFRGRGGLRRDDESRSWQRRRDGNGGRSPKRQD